MIEFSPVCIIRHFFLIPWGDVFYCIVYDNCSDYDNRMLDKAQLSAAKIILGLADLNLTSLHLRREISLLCYVTKLIFDMVPCPFPASCFRSFKEFVPYALRHNQNVQIPLLKKSLSYNFFLRKASSLWNSLPLEIKSSANHSIFMNRLNSHYHISKKSTQSPDDFHSLYASLRP